jgi:type I site-specific restriction endonuclease
MDFSFNDLDNTVRPADKVFKEQLVEDNRSDFEKELDEALRISLEEAISLNDLNKDFEEELIKKFEKEKIERKEIFAKFLLDLNRIIRLDKDIKDVYEIIEPIIDGYCNQLIYMCEFDQETYDKIFKVLSTVRTNQTCVDILKTIIIKL